MEMVPAPPSLGAVLSLFTQRGIEKVAREDIERNLISAQVLESDVATMLVARRRGRLSPGLLFREG